MQIIYNDCHAMQDFPDIQNELLYDRAVNISSLINFEVLGKYLNIDENIENNFTCKDYFYKLIEVAFGVADNYVSAFGEKFVLIIMVWSKAIDEILASGLKRPKKKDDLLFSWEWNTHGKMTNTKLQGEFIVSLTSGKYIDIYCILHNGVDTLTEKEIHCILKCNAIIALLISFYYGIAYGISLMPNVAIVSDNYTLVSDRNNLVDLAILHDYVTIH